MFYNNPSPVLLYYPDRNHRVAVELRASELPNIKGITVANVPAGILEVYLAPNNAFHHYHQDTKHNAWTLRLTVHSLVSVDAIYGPGLDALFAYMSTAVHAGKHWNRMPTYSTIAEGVRLYRALTAVRLHNAADCLRADLMQKMKTYPLSAADLQTVWFAAKDTPEWCRWIDAALQNLAHFKLWDWKHGYAAEAEKINSFMEREMKALNKEQWRAVEGTMRVIWGMTTAAESNEGGFF